MTLVAATQTPTAQVYSRPHALRSATPAEAFAAGEAAAVAAISEGPSYAIDFGASETRASDRGEVESKTDARDLAAPEHGTSPSNIVLPPGGMEPYEVSGSGRNASVRKYLAIAPSVHGYTMYISGQTFKYLNYYYHWLVHRLRPTTTIRLRGCALYRPSAPSMDQASWYP